MTTEGLEVVDIDGRGHLLVNGCSVIDVGAYLRARLDLVTGIFLPYLLPHRCALVVAMTSEWRVWLVVSWATKTIELLPPPGHQTIPTRDVLITLPPYLITDGDIDGHFIVRGRGIMLLTIPTAGPYRLTPYPDAKHACLASDGVLVVKQEDFRHQVYLHSFDGAEKRLLGSIRPDEKLVSHFGPKLVTKWTGRRIALYSHTGSSQNIRHGTPVLPARAATIWQHQGRTYQYDGETIRQLPYVSSDVELVQVTESRTGDVFLYGERNDQHIVYQNGKKLSLPYLTDGSLMDDTWARARRYWRAAQRSLGVVLPADLVGYVRAASTWST